VRRSVVDRSRYLGSGGRRRYRMSTRKLIIAAMVTGMAILVAGAVMVFSLAR
jgi:hypothetical protein